MWVWSVMGHLLAGERIQSSPPLGRSYQGSAGGIHAVVIVVVTLVAASSVVLATLTVLDARDVPGDLPGAGAGEPAAGQRTGRT
jgi:hypothetical protein